MEFNKEHKIKDWKKLNIVEAEEYLEFLRRERGRHREHNIRCQSRAEFWLSEANRQDEEEVQVQLRINEVQEFYHI